MIDAVRSRFPAELGCVIDAAMTSQSVAIGSDPRIGTTIVIVSRAFVANCPAMSNVGPDLYVATIGGGLLSDGKKSVLKDPQWARAREYLLHDPIAIAAELPGRRIVAVAQPEPLDGWMAIDAANPTEVEAEINELVARWRRTSNAQLANKLRNTRKGAQVLVRIEKLDVDDLVALTTDLLRSSDAAAETKRPALVCPPLDDNIKACKDGSQLTVGSVQSTLLAMTDIDMAPVVAGGDIVGLRLVADAPRLLRAGDIILGVNNRRLTTKEQLSAVLTDPGKKADVAIRRDGLDLVIRLSE
ncbi:MAG TPA: hypothetical protein VLB44_03845 [Kofleriaceae bacterium]|nr:hypothetical protein [Kofleriaceae bacterium]